MKRGEVWWVNFEPSIGSEIRKIRPAVIVSNNAANTHLNRVQVIPLTSNINKCYPSEATVVFNELTNKAMADQLTTVDKKRLQSCAGNISSDDMKLIEKAIKIQLGLPL